MNVETNNDQLNTCEIDEDIEFEEVEGREIGIDLGTTNSIVAYVEQGKVKILKVKNKEIIPSALYFETKEKFYCGVDALKRGAIHPERLVTLFKRHMHSENRNLKVLLETIQKSKIPTKSLAKTYLVDAALLPSLDSHFLGQLAQTDTILIPAHYHEYLDEIFFLSANNDIEKALNFVNQYSDRLTVHSEDFTYLKEINPSAIQSCSKSQQACLALAAELKPRQPIILTRDANYQKIAAELHYKCQYYDAGFFIQIDEINDIEQQEETAEEIEDAFYLNGLEATTYFLRYLKEQAQNALGAVSKAVITVPANFSTVEVEATKQAALLAGFDTVEIEREPNAAAVAYGFENQGQNLNLLVYDFGGGTFDVSIVHSDGKGVFKTKATDGNPKLGGENITTYIVEKLQEELDDQYALNLWTKEDSGLSDQHYLENMTTLRNMAEQAKIELTDLETATIDLPDLYVKKDQTLHHTMTLSRNDFNKILSKNILPHVENALKQTIQISGLNLSQIHDVLLAGGTSKIPLLQQKAADFFKEVTIRSARNVQTVIAEGAALLAAAKFNISETGIKYQPKTYDRTNHDFGVAVNGRIFDCLIPSGEDLPVTCEKTYQLIKDYQELLQIECFQRHQSSPAKLTTEEGIDYLESILISGLPPMRQNEVDICVKFSMTKEYTLKVEVILFDKQGNCIKDEMIDVKRES